MTQELFELAVVVLLAGVLGVVVKLLKQPVILAYLLTGIIVSAFTSFHLVSSDAFRLFSDLGIMFLLFLVGLEINYSSLRLVGGPALMLGLAQIVLTFFAGFFIAGALGFAMLPAIYLAAALTFSSTIIVVKLLSDLNDLQSLYGKLALGLLIVQDVVAIFALLALGGVQSGSAGASFGWMNFGVTVLKGAVLFSAMFFLGKRAVPWLFEKIGRSQELLFLLSLAWLFVVAALVSRVGFSIEIAGFLAGFALANSSEHFQIATKMRPLRDFFILGFFVFLGSSIGISHFAGFSVPMAALLGFVLVVKPLIVLGILYALGYRKRTNFMTGLAVSQISEFSLILVALGVKLGHIDETLAATVSVVGALSILVSSYFMTHAEKIMNALSFILRFAERKHTRETHSPSSAEPKPIILVGAHRTGQSILMALSPKDVLVVDFDPEVTNRLREEGIEYLFGDMSDDETFDAARAAEAKLVISTSPKAEENELLLARIKKLPEPRPKFIARADTEREALSLYEKGADYVLLPHFTSGQYLGKTIAIDPEMPVIADLKRNDLEILHRRAR